ncbi:hypothetical protein B0H11DRAFT_1956811 [Mycena galericulata]|nr:hypothetical protein B0H11DRAFT_2015461 [Mycena galericulata]KAJ7510978.1 hypothetical protein B0H11DRAFT_1956811 [Mycena galericulata]
MAHLLLLLFPLDCHVPSPFWATSSSGITRHQTRGICAHSPQQILRVRASEVDRACYGIGTRHISPPLNGKSYAFTILLHPTRQEPLMTQPSGRTNFSVKHFSSLTRVWIGKTYVTFQPPQGGIDADVSGVICVAQASLNDDSGKMTAIMYKENNGIGRTYVKTQEQMYQISKDGQKFRIEFVKHVRAPEVSVDVGHTPPPFIVEVGDGNWFTLGDVNSSQKVATATAVLIRELSQRKLSLDDCWDVSGGWRST